MLSKARRNGYCPISLEGWIDGDHDETAPLLVLRHDVDQDPKSALKMLEIEAEARIRSTWYFRWRTAHPRVIARVRAEGGDIGLHYETLTRTMLERGDRGSRAVDLVPEARLRLKEEIASFQRHFGPIRSVCPHGDTRVPGVRNAVLLEDEDCSDFGIEFDGNAAMRHMRPGFWLTDRVASEGGWADGVDPERLLDEAISPILAVIHPNNWASGFSLWVDRLAQSLSAAGIEFGTVPTSTSDLPLGPDYG